MPTKTVMLSAATVQLLRQRLLATPLNRLVGFELVALELDHCTMRLPYQEALTNGLGTLHGGILASMADVAVAFALATNFNGSMGFATVDLNIHFLRRARSDVLAQARILKKGERLSTGEVNLTDDAGETVARALATFILTTSRFPYAPNPQVENRN